MVTEVDPTNPEPWMVIDVPPPLGPCAGLIEVMVGVPATFTVMSWVASGSVPLCAVSVRE